MEKEISEFLDHFKLKLSIWGVLFRDDRGKNAQTLADLEITPNIRIEILKNLQVENYFEGPLKETLYKGADMWVFGTLVKNKEIYIKITEGFEGSQVLCISFHIAEYPMNFPLKNKNL